MALMHPPIYDPMKSYAENGRDGPFFSGDIPQRASLGESIDFLGLKVFSPIGVPAGPLLNSRWIALAARLGFDILTYKTIRSFAHPGHSLPNIVFVEREEGKARQINAPSSLRDLSITNSFGMPSMSPDFLMEDIGNANRALRPGQVMIVSVVGTPGRGGSFLEDFVRTALLAKEAGARIIEANFSCPNVGKSEGCLYRSASDVFSFVKAIADAIKPTPLIIKTGMFARRAELHAALVAAARGGARGVCGLNSISMEVVATNGEPALGPGRIVSGVCGGAIRKDALSFIKDAAAINEEERLGLTLLGCGGLTLSGHLEEMLAAGAHIAMSATGMIWNPYLALQYHEARHAISYS